MTAHATLMLSVGSPVRLAGSYQPFDMDDPQPGAPGVIGGRDVVHGQPLWRIALDHGGLVYAFTSELEAL